MKQLTQAIFKDAPDWAASAAVDNDGKGYWFAVPANKLKIEHDQWIAPKEGDFFAVCDRIGFSWTRFDTTDWQNSATDRETVK